VTEGRLADPAAIEIENLSKSYSGVVALEVERFRLEPRSTLALIGPSGCGKSTLLRLIVGLLRPDRGQVCVVGSAVTPETRRSLQLRMGYVIQEGGLFPHLTTAENVALVAKDVGWTRDKIRARTDELLELTRIPPTLLARYPGQLSGGQRQRVALMRALMLDPDLLLLDEPLTALDPMIRSDLQDELKALFERLRKSVLFVTHDMAEAAFVAGEMAIMRTGRILQRGSFQDLIRHPADPFVTEFIRRQRPLDLAELAR
jgi:osmoprotectant transport system ATP-binding protein